MNGQYDYLIVGSGLTGSTIARLLFNQGFKVLVVERRSHVGGNVFDHYHQSGIRIHTYGPHYFRTSDKNIWNYVNRFSGFYKYFASVKSYVDERYESWPISSSYIESLVGPNWKPCFKGIPTNFEDAALSKMPELIYRKFIHGYNIKQWGIDPKLLSKKLMTRFQVRYNGDERLMPNHKYQGIPELGYANLMKNMLSGIPVLLNVDYLQNRDLFKFKKMVVFAGPIDEYFGYKLGKLKYRGQIRTHTYFSNVDYVQPCGQINNPSLDNGPHIRTLEWKYMMQKEVANCLTGTVLTTEVTETPTNPDNYEYPFPSEDNISLYNQYKLEADHIANLLVCGRLGEYRYYDMDQAIGRAFHLVREKILC